MKQTRTLRQPLAICLALSALTHAALIELPGPRTDGNGVEPIVMILRPAPAHFAAESPAKPSPAPLTKPPEAALLHRHGDAEVGVADQRPMLGQDELLCGHRPGSMSVGAVLFLARQGGAGFEAAAR